MHPSRHARRRCLRPFSPSRTLSSAALLLVALLAGACASGPYRTTLLVVGGEALNPTFDEQPSAVNVRIFPLIDREAFDNASLDELRAVPPTLPPATWLPPQKEVAVYVGKADPVALEIKPKVRFLGILALFNEDTGTYRAVLPVGDVAANKVVFDRYSVAIAPREPDDDRPAEPAPAAEAGRRRGNGGGGAR